MTKVGGYNVFFISYTHITFGFHQILCGKHKVNAPHSLCFEYQHTPNIFNGIFILFQVLGFFPVFHPSPRPRFPDFYYLQKVMFNRCLRNGQCVQEGKFLTSCEEVGKSRGTKFFVYMESTYGSEKEVKYCKNALQNIRAKLKQ